MRRTAINNYLLRALLVLLAAAVLAAHGGHHNMEQDWIDMQGQRLTPSPRTRAPSSPLGAVRARVSRLRFTATGLEQSRTEQKNESTENVGNPINKLNFRIP
jgi:hypothetical protein